jgi:hypothetical protein
MATNSPSLKMQPNSTIAIVHSNISGWRMTLPGDKGVWGIHAGDWGQVYLVDHEEEDEKASISRNFNSASKNIH